MCGIAGFWDANVRGDDATRALDRMCGTLVHRGPDEGGQYVAPPISLGMRRLSIIDVAHGQQPIGNEDGSIQVIFNGEIYNHALLRGDLQVLGHRFKTASDTEVIVHAYEQWGTACFARLWGMFAIAVWDGPARRLVLARDRFGKKPLFYHHRGQMLFFASEMKALLAGGVADREVDPIAADQYFTFGYIPGPRSIMRSIKKVPPGTFLVFNGDQPAMSRFWQLTLSDPAPIAEEDAAAEIRRLLEDAVRVRLMSEVPLGAFLSGGIDSSAVVGLMARENGVPVKTFSVGYRESEFDEAPYARRVAEWFGTEHHELVATPRDIRLLDDVLVACDEPFADASAIPTYLVARLARQHVKVVLSGDGGDELFAGYDRYLVDQRESRLGMLGDLGLGAPLRLASNALPEGARGKNFLRHFSMPRMSRYLDAISLFPDRALRDLLEGGVASAAPPLFAEALQDSQGLDALSRLQDLDLQTNLPGDILTKVDRMTMAHSLEARVPLLDHPLVEFACRLPARLRLRGDQTKYLLRRVLRGRVPDEVLSRPKRGFGVPIRAWFGHHLPNFFRERLGNSRTLQEIGIRPQAVHSLLDLFQQRGREDHCGRLWALAVLESTAHRLLKGERA